MSLNSKIHCFQRTRQGPVCEPSEMTSTIGQALSQDLQTIALGHLPKGH